MNGSEGKKYYGKYRGTVSDNRDPLLLGRVQAKIPDVLGDNDSTWAMPCTPYAGKGVGLFLIPPVNASVWIEFEQGDIDYPIWTGCFWALGEVPATPAVAEMKVLKTDLATITINDLQGAGGITIEASIGTGAKVVLNVTGIEISSGSGKIQLAASGVSINDGALEVT
jgi:hypothetical protein